MRFKIKKFSTGLRSFSNGSKEYFINLTRPSLYTVKTLKKNTLKDSFINFRKHNIKKYKI